MNIVKLQDIKSTHRNPLHSYTLIMSPQMGSVPVMTQPSLIYSQPVMRPPNPFGPVSGAQVLINMLHVTCTVLDVEEI